MRCPDSGRVMGPHWACAVGRFDHAGTAGYKAATMPDAPLRATRAEAIEDERLWRITRARNTDEVRS